MSSKQEFTQFCGNVIHMADMHNLGNSQQIQMDVMTQISIHTDPKQYTIESELCDLMTLIKISSDSLSLKRV